LLYVEVFASGVAHSAVIPGNVGSPRLPRWFGPPFSPSVARAVGQDEHSLALVRSANGARFKMTPLRIEPALGKVK